MEENKGSTKEEMEQRIGEASEGKGRESGKECDEGMIRRGREGK